LEAEEAKYIRNHKCVNRIIPGRCKQEFCEDNKESLKEYRETNKKENKNMIKHIVKKIMKPLK
jgi:ketol-acid reductoisomerase